MARAWAGATAAHPCFCVRTHVGVGAHHGTAQVRDELIRLRPLRDLLRRLLGLQGGSSRTQREGEASIRVPDRYCQWCSLSIYPPCLCPREQPPSRRAAAPHSCSHGCSHGKEKRKEARRVREQPRARNSTTREHASEKKVPLV